MPWVTARFTIGWQFCHSSASRDDRRYTRNMSSAADHVRWSSCPPWCLTRHDDWDIEPGGHYQARWPSIHTDDGTSVDIATAQNDDGEVVVWADAEHGSMLTSEEARAAARALFEAPSGVDDHPTA
jgi:hypothetical protein